MSEFKKTDKQKEAIKILAGESKFNALLGGSRSGKTFALSYAEIVRACKVKSRHLVLRQNFNHAKRSLWLDTFPKVFNLAFPNLKVKPNKTDYYYKFSNDSEIWIGGLDDKERVEKILGTEYSTIWFNEASQMDYSSIQTAITRLAEKNDLKKKVYFDFNPPKKSHWSYYLFIKKLDPIDNIPLEDTDNYKSLLMNPTDNLENIDPDYLKLLESMPESDRDRFLYGLFTDESDGQVYYSFKQDIHVRETKIIPGSILIGMDFNVNPFCAVIGQYYDNTFYIHDEAYLENSDTYKMSAELKSKGFSGAKVYPDSTGRNRKTSGQTDFQILKDSGFVVESTHNPFVTDRTNNVNRLFAENRIVINPKCRKLINDLDKVVWKNSELFSGPDKMLTHISDALGYLCWKLDPFNKEVQKVYTGQR